jgi:hypothetical protein
MSVQGLHIDGGDGQAAGAYLVDQLRSIGMLGDKERPAPAEVGGKQVGTVAYGETTVYLYSGADTAWAIATEDQAAAAELLAALP